MNNKEMETLIKARKLAKPFRVTDDAFCLKDIDPADTLEFTSEDKPRAKEALAMGIDLLSRASRHALCAGPLDVSSDAQCRVSPVPRCAREDVSSALS